MKDPCNHGTPKRQKPDIGEQSSPLAESAMKKRKSPVRRTPRKPSKNSTPKKNGGPVAALPDSPKIDLWLEAKLSAEEDKKMFAGRKIHPFFSLWKVEKKNQEQEQGLSEAKREGGGTACGPIHVFENVQDDAAPLDWSDWTFLDETTIVDFGPESSNLSVLECSVEPLHFDNFPSASRSSSALISQNAMSCPDKLSILPDNMIEISRVNSAMLANEQPICLLKPEDAKVDLKLEVNEVNTFSGHNGIFRKSDIEPPSKFLQERMRSYYHSCEVKDVGSLWIHKYKPTKAFEMCGNEEATNFLRDWLHLWHERRYQCRKDSSNRDGSNRQDDDYICSDSDYAPEDVNKEDSLHNVLLITGPIGSGKSAAVYACAQEQGFEVLELNTSDCRNGASVRQCFGEALKSHRIKRLLDHIVSPHKKPEKLLPAPALPNGIAAEEMTDQIEPITISNDEAHSPGGTPPPTLHGKTNVFTCDSVHTLILVEDVDILFPEDRGCIAAIQHISETAKGPIILTSNSNNAGLPNSFARLHISFRLPSPHELLCHMYMVCVTEKVNINHLLLKRFIQSCDGDIRKATMQLQFWFQSKKHMTDRKVQKVYDSLPFDLEACHRIIPKILPLNYPSELSKLIEKEVAKSITIMEENSCMQGLVNKKLDINEMKNSLDVQCINSDYLEANVDRNNRSLTDSGEFENQHNAISELPNWSGFPVTSSWQKGQSKLIVMSSDFVEKYPNNGHSLDIHEEVYERHSLESNSESRCKFQLNQTDPGPSMAMDMVQNLWRKLRVCRKDLGQHTNPEQLGVIQVIKLTAGLTNLISEADLLFRNHQQEQCGIMEPPMSLSDEATYIWYDEQAMMSTVAVHGFCFYAKRISDVGSKSGCKNEVDLTSEMLACTNDIMALGKLSRQDQTKSTSIYAEKQLEMNNPTNDTKRTSLSNVIQSIIPARSSLAMKGLALNEYISSLRQISISEGFRITHGSGKMRKRRRSAQHYLSRGTMLSPEDISLLCEGDLCRKISSLYIANMESNST